MGSCAQTGELVLNSIAAPVRARVVDFMSCLESKGLEAYDMLELTPCSMK